MTSRRAKVAFQDAKLLELIALTTLITSRRRGQVDAKLKMIQEVKIIADDLNKMFIEDVVKAKILRFRRASQVRDNSSKSRARGTKPREPRRAARLVAAVNVVASEAHRVVPKRAPKSTPAPVSRIASPPKKAPVIVISKDLADDDPRAVPLWGLSPQVWLRLSRTERAVWNELNRSASASGSARLRIPPFLKGRGIAKARGTLKPPLVLLAPREAYASAGIRISTSSKRSVESASYGVKGDVRNQ
mmetsp:Transcript_8489/g.25637  ORF Transcript_8489/g.25637 Transcript_8489/m.25637 type:complete len:246 (-) Transcript_8489:648-1385(-)|eukprot:CAMPEP_0113542916 /NCGR_PEP_ID=MMETSP0015_2-20120614/9875_1 /TAXON_ID=2838 /ORGANISM="Odontella" /LENGTH=245 /DNA_ID=CAMNT_0000443031 /DNA_START=686 /DNA_END=1423 /DNA_ORIENTATION=- /assembly_acc=CAM_ASM_000160